MTQRTSDLTRTNRSAPDPDLADLRTTDHGPYADLDHGPMGPDLDTTLTPDHHGPRTEVRRTFMDRLADLLRTRTELKVRARTAEADLKVRGRLGEVRADRAVRAAVREESAADRQAAADQRVADQRAKVAVRTAKRTARADLWSGRTVSVRTNADAILSMLVYASAVGSAVFGQVSVATGQYHWSTGRALLMAGFIEVVGLAMALTSNKLRLRGERGLAPRILTWAFASFAATVNIWGHIHNPLMATVLGAASIGGITMWEIRSSAKHRAELRRLGQIGQPLTRFGLRAWVRYFPLVRGAWSQAVLEGLAPPAQALVVRSAEVRLARQVRRSAESALRSAQTAMRSVEGPADLGPAIADLADLVRDLNTARTIEVRTLRSAIRTTDHGPRTEVRRTADLPTRTTDHGPSDADHGPRTTDLRSGPEVRRTELADHTNGPTDQRTTDHGPEVRRTTDHGPRTNGPTDRTGLATVRAIRSGTHEADLRATREEFAGPDMPRFADLHRFITDRRTSRGLNGSKSATCKIQNLLLLERTPTAEDDGPAVVDQAL